MKKSTQKKPQPANSLPSQEQLVHDHEINRRAYELWEAAGGKHGDDMRHWLEAEREVRARRASAKP